MRDPALDRNLEETRELHQRWSQFHDFFNMAAKGTKVTPEAEMKFLDLKTRIAMLHDGFMQSLKHDHKVGQNVLQILGQCIMLRRIPNLSNAEVQKIEFDWNEAYLLMTETVANLEEEQERLASISENAWKMQKAKERFSTSMNNFLVGPWFKLILVLGILGFIIVGVPMLGIYDYKNLKRDLPWSAPVYDRVMSGIRFVYSDLSFSELKEAETGLASREDYPPDDAGVSQITPEFVYSQLPNLGFDPAYIQEVKEIFDRRIGFDKEKRSLKNARGQSMYAYYILFRDADDAKRFVELRRRGVEKLDQQIRDNLNATLNVARKANFVAIFVSAEEELRSGFGQKKFKFKESQMYL